MLLRLTGLVLLIIFFGAILYSFVYIRSSKPTIMQVLAPTPTTIGPTATPISGASFPINSSTEPTTFLIWKQYSNQQLGISFEYPVDWVVIPDESNYLDKDGKIAVRLSTLLLFSQVEYNKGNGHLDRLIRPIRIDYWDNPRHLSLQGYNDSLTYKHPVTGLTWSPGLFSLTTTTATIAGRQVYYDSKADCEPNLCDQYVIPYSNKFIELELVKLGSPAGKYEELSYGYPEYKVSPIFSHLINTLNIY